MTEHPTAIISEEDDGPISPFEHPNLNDEFRARLLYVFTVAAERQDRQVLQHFHDQDLIDQITQASVMEWEETLDLKPLF